MRKVWLVGAALMSVATVLPVLAQQQSGPPANQFFTGVNPRQVNNVKIDPTRALKRSNMGSALQSPVAQRPSPFSLGSVFPRVTLGTWPPKLPGFSQSGAIPVPTATPFNKAPTTAAVPNGARLFDAPR